MFALPRYLYREGRFMKLTAKVIDKLKGVVPASELARLQALLRAPETVGRKGLALTCPGCGGKVPKLDNVCGACSALKCDRPRRFWHYVIDREVGGDGRPKAEPRAPREDVLRHEFTGPGIVAMGGVPCLPAESTAVESPRWRWLVVTGHGSVIVVAAWKADAMKYAKKRLGLGVTEGFHLALKMERTTLAEPRQSEQMISE